jgi:hypothetical protein
LMIWSQNSGSAERKADRIDLWYWTMHKQQAE